MKGKAGPLSRTSSALALPSLAGASIAGGISRAFETAARAKASANAASNATTNGTMTPFANGRLPGIPSSLGSNNSDSDESSTGAQAATTLPTTPRAYPGSGAATPGGGLFGAMSPHNPVWKHEVSL